MNEYWVADYKKAINDWDRSMVYLNHCNPLNENVIQKIKKHIKEYKLTDQICAWYENMTDFYSDWCDKYNGYYSKEEAREIYDEGICDGEFQRIKGYGILRYVV